MKPLQKVDIESVLMVFNWTTNTRERNDAMVCTSSSENNVLLFPVPLDAGYFIIYHIVTPTPPKRTKEKGTNGIKSMQNLGSNCSGPERKLAM
jgi:hypothetical protein